jgi:hypothetical protein
MTECKQFNPTEKVPLPEPEIDPRWAALEAKWGDIIQTIMEIKICGGVLKCGNAFVDKLEIGLKPCIPEFYKLCDFDLLIRVCPFDPAWDAFEWKQQIISERMQALEVQVKELQVKVQRAK